MSFGIVVPYRGSTEARRRIAERVIGLLVRRFRYSDVKITVADAGGEPFSRAASINQGVAELGDVEPILVNDADSFCALPQLLTALRWAAGAKGLVYAYTRYVRLGPDGREGWSMDDAPSLGCMAIRRYCFETVGGFDEGFRGWGYEDCDFRDRCAALWPIRRVEGELIHLWHDARRADDSPLSADPEYVAANWKRYSDPQIALHEAIQASE